MKRNIFFTSDTHFAHKNIIKYSKRPFDDIKHHDEMLIRYWNETVMPDDEIYHLGDFCFASTSYAESVLRRLNGRKYFIFGNHDKPVKKTQLLEAFFEDFGFYKEIKVPDKDSKDGKNQMIVLCHYPIESWNKRHHGAWHMHGHCVDYETEILTEEGWKTRDQITPKDCAATLNIESGDVEYQKIDKIIDKVYTGLVVNIEGRNVNGRFTDGHTCILESKKGKYEKILAKDFSQTNNRKIPLNGKNTKEDFFIQDDEIRLMVWVAADGSLENKNLVRFHLKKQRKINRLKELLGRLNIQYSENIQKSGTTKINFNNDRSLIRKPLSNVVLSFSKRQVDILTEEYCHTDGRRSSESCFQIYTSKKEEADLLQHLLVTNEYSCNLWERKRKNSNHKTGYVLSANTKKHWQTSKSYKNYLEENVNNEFFWCLIVKNQTLFIRRKGMVHITGNCHHNLPYNGTQATRVDVGVDGWDYRPVSYYQIKSFINRRLKSGDVVNLHDHHGKREQ